MVAFIKALAATAASQLVFDASAAAVRKRAPSGVPSFALDYGQCGFLLDTCDMADGIGWVVVSL